MQTGQCKQHVVVGWNLSSHQRREEQHQGKQ